MADLQEQLGDPSGRSSAEYWDEWFQKVCGTDSPDGFEWYCDAVEVARIISLQLASRTRSEKNKQSSETNCPTKIASKVNISIIHPGSGNSAVPFRLRDEYGFSVAEGSKQCIIDCSAFAIQEMKERAALMHRQQAPVHQGIIDYEVGDVLKPPLPYADEAFDVWVDKGLVDALFCGSEDKVLEEIRQCTTLFREAHRVLKNNGDGICIVVSLAQEHTLRLLLHASGLLHWHEVPEEMETSLCWLGPLEIYEVKPLSDASSLRPFAFVLRNGPLTDLLSTDEPAVIFNNESGEVRGTVTKKTLSFDTVNDMLQASRDEYLQKWKINQQLKTGSEVDLGNEEDMYVLATIHIKPWGVDTNLQDLKVRIKNSEDNCAFVGHTWKSDEIKPIGFGISLLQMSCIVRRNELEDLCEKIASQEEEYVQSVDIDWDNTFRVMSAESILSKINE